MRLPEIFRRIVLLAIAFAGLPCAVFAQQANGNQPAPDSLNVGFQVYLWSDPPHLQKEVVLRPTADGSEPELQPYEPAQLKFVNGANATEAITSSRQRLSRPSRYNGQNPLVFVREERGMDGELVRTEVGRVNIPTSASRVILLVFPQGNRVEESYRIIAVPASERELPAGTALVLNISENEIASRIGSEQVVLNGGTAQQIQLKGFQNGALPVIVGTRDSEGQWQQTFANNLITNERGTAIFVLHEDTGSARMQMIRPNPRRDRQAD